MPKISQVYSHEIIDSRATPTIETVIRLDTGQTVTASVPAGASTGKYEAVELRDNDPSRYMGKGVLKAVSNVNEKLGPSIIGFDPQNQQEIDKKLIELDGSENKIKLGANAILSVSLAVAKAGAVATTQPLYRWINSLSVNMGATDNTSITRLPTPVFNMINGGLHGAGNLDFQEFQVIPATSKSFSQALQSSVEVYHSIKDSLVRRGAIHSVGDEGGFAPNLFANADALQIAVEAINEKHYVTGQDFFLGLDVVGNVIFKQGNYIIKDKSTPLNTASLLAFYEEINEIYKLTYLEDPFTEDDWSGWKEITEKLGSNLMIIGDDLLVTNPKKVKKAIEEKACNAILVKPNQIGTVTETLEVMKLARDAGWKTIISHRSGETNDYFIADFAVGTKSDYTKFGAPARGERVAKYNRLLTIEAEISSLDLVQK